VEGPSNSFEVPFGDDAAGLGADAGGAAYTFGDAAADGAVRSRLVECAFGFDVQNQAVGGDAGGGKVRIGLLIADSSNPFCDGHAGLGAHVGFGGERYSASFGNDDGS